MADFADVHDVEVLYGAALGDPVRVEELLVRIDGEIRSAVGQHITEVASDTVTIWGSGTTTLLFPERPVTAVADSVTLDGDAVAAASYELRANRLVRTDGGVWTSGAEISVTYDHGTPATQLWDLRMLAAQVALLRWTPTAGVRQETIADYSVTYADADPATVLETHAVIERWRRRLGASRGVQSVKVTV